NEVLKHFRQAAARGTDAAAAWQRKLEVAKQDSPDLRRNWESFWDRPFAFPAKVPLPSWSAQEKPIATRKASQKVMNALAPHLPHLIGGSADLAESNLTYLENAGEFQKENRLGRNLRFGIREHGMGAILNGIALAAPFVPFGSTFLTFLDYMKPAVRVAALSHLHVIYIFTHDSIGLGEDGPTHQPVEQLWSLRATPNLFVFRPADANETAHCWSLALERTDGPSALALTRQNLPVLDPESSCFNNVKCGGYVLAESSGSKPDVLLIATGSEVALALQARAILEQEEIATRVISMPCVELFDLQPPEYRERVLPSEVVHRVAVEAGATCGWWKYVGVHGDVVGLDHFGASAPGDVLLEKFGLTPQNIAARAKSVITGR
ncbi:transketolase, partial [bacterium]|nr:transketolase [bacterium]